MIETRGLGVTLGGRRLLEGVELTLAPGRIIGLVGESGSGKSLTALAIIGLLPAQARVSGQVLLDGADLTALPEREMQAIRGRRIAMIFQEPMTALNPLMSIGDQVAEVLRIHHDMPRDAALDLARDRLDRVGLTAPRFGLGLFPHELSGGQRQRVAIAMAIAERPDLLIADEPTTALDVTTQAQILDLLRDLVRVEGMALLLITHDLAVVAGMADEVAVMKDGSIVEAGPTEAVFRGRTHPYTQALFAASLHRPAAPEAAPFAPHPPLLEVRGARREYRTGTRGFWGRAGRLRAVDDVSFDLEQGESLGLVGESGCGKSTLARAILGLEPLQAGEIILDGEPVPSARAMSAGQRAKVQAVFQDPFGSFNPRWKVERLLAEPFHLGGRPPDWRARVVQALSDVDLPQDSLSRYIHEFSGGQRQRLAIARALMIRPRLIVLDEAVSALDVRVRARVLDLLAALRDAYGLAYLFISHDLGVVRGITDNVLVMERGRIVEAGPTSEVLDAPEHPATQRLVAASPRIPMAWSKP